MRPLIPRSMRHFKQRLLVSTATISLLLLFISLSIYPAFMPFFAAIVALAICTALWELYRIAEKKRLAPLKKVAMVVSFLFVMGVYAKTQTALDSITVSWLLLLTLFCGFFTFFFVGKNPIENLSVTLFGIIYLTIPLSFIIPITFFFPTDHLQDGRWWLVYALTIPKVADAGAYFFGKAFGKRPLASTISPKKTVEGAIGGLCTAIVVSAFFPLLPEALSGKEAFIIGKWQSLILGGCLGILSEFGDLAESLLKRDAKVKDSNELPGLGGMLDMVDSLIFSIPAVYLFLTLESLQP